MKKNNRGGGGLKLGSHLRSDVHRRQSEGERVFYISHVSFDSSVSKKYLLGNFRHDTASKHPPKPSLSPRVSLRSEVGMQTRDFSITALLTYTHYCKHRIAPSPHGEQTYLYKAKPVPLYRGASVYSLISMIQSERRLDVRPRWGPIGHFQSWPVDVVLVFSQITATSSKVTTISNWRTAAWRSSSWVKSQRTGSAAEHFFYPQNVS